MTRRDLHQVVWPVAVIVAANLVVTLWGAW